MFVNQRITGARKANKRWYDDEYDELWDSWYVDNSTSIMLLKRVWSYLYICVAFDEVCSVWIREGLKKRKNGWSIFEKNVFFPLCGLGKKALPPSLPLIFSLFSVKFPLGRGSFRKPLSFYWINPINTRVHQNKLGSEMELKGSKEFIDHSIKI